MLPGWCCIAIAAWEQRTETTDTTCALSGSISGAGKSIEIRLRMCGPLCKEILTNLNYSDVAVVDDIISG